MTKELASIYRPEAREVNRKEEERRLAQEGIQLWNARKEELQRRKQLEQSELRRMLATYWPWGRPGGGAPCVSALRKKNVPLEPSEKPLLSLQSESAPQSWDSKSAINELHNSYNCYDKATIGMHPASDERKMREERATSRRLSHDFERRYSGARGVDAHPSQSTRHVATDATRPGYTIDSYRLQNAWNRDYISDLTDQMRKKQEKAVEESHRERDSTRRHFETWRKFWGRPGHGAPIDQAHRRNNLNDILYRTPMFLSVGDLGSTDLPISTNRRREYSMEFHHPMYQYPL